MNKNKTINITMSVEGQAESGEEIKEQQGLGGEEITLGKQTVYWRPSQPWECCLLLLKT